MNLIKLWGTRTWEVIEIEHHFLIRRNNFDWTLFFQYYSLESKFHPHKVLSYRFRANRGTFHVKKPRNESGSGFKTTLQSWNRWKDALGPASLTHTNTVKRNQWQSQGNKPIESNRLDSNRLTPPARKTGWGRRDSWNLMMILHTFIYYDKTFEMFCKN